MDDADDAVADEDSPLESIAAGAAMVVGFGVAAVLLALNVSYWWVGFILIGGLVPLFQGVAKWYEADAERSAQRTPATTDGTPDDQQDALDELRARYARGELTEAEFERRLERLLETETVADARDAVRRSRDDESEREPATE
ncbi:SHOCT domain-containing protein [Haloarcula litorea]|uniref:SHOCT domain-containing protein n=1 Tax=Haloarcula litorea TaxID=3032579 RepID=UPI0023E89786|nr:SHOCT domain-containing protein [Halomicroarcula sp. GDY20]